MKCEWYDKGYCSIYGTSEEQEEKETQYLCDGTIENMIECGEIKNG